MPHKRYRRAAAPVVAALAALVATACSSSPHRAASVVTLRAEPTTTTSTTTTTTTTTTTIPASTTTTVPPFAETVGTVTAADIPGTWRPGCPVPPADLRIIHLSYWGFDGHAHTGAIVVNQSVVPAVITIFRTLYNARFPIYEMVPQDAYHGDDNAAAAADDTSGFNCRDAVAPGPPQWSVHAFGEAIDVNDVQNPYVDGTTVIPPTGAAYLDRTDIRPGMGYRGGVLVNAFASVGWQWGGRWSPGTDYQHFSSTGG